MNASKSGVSRKYLDANDERRNPNIVPSYRDVEGVETIESIAK